ncbi:MAG: hypothetical protein ACK452_01785, partial [Bacteroidota bacterium]
NLEKKLNSAKFFAFDICYLNGYKLTDLPLVMRKDILQNIFQNKEFKSIKLSPFIKAEGKKFFNEIKNRNGEGIIAKDAFSLYHPGTRTKSWLKIKNLHEQEAVILGFTQPQGERKFFGSIILGIKKNKKWIYIGHCATGFTNVMLENLYKKFSNSLSYDTPFHIPLKLENKIQWVKPKYVCQIQFNEWTEEGLMRQPVFIDIKKNKSIKEIKLEVSENK